MPPRHGKSLTTTVRFPAWWLGRNPEKRVIIAAHTASLAYTFSRRVRNEFAEFGGEVFGERVSDDSSAVDKWELHERRGGVVAAGVGGPITGQGADLMVVDDPVKDAEAASSETQRAAAIDWWRTTARTRLHPGGAVVLVMTRWHEADLAGWLLSEMQQGTGEDWETLTLPMVDDAGRILWPERYDAEEVANIRRAVGSRAWEALYQQRPTPADGAIFKKDWFRHRYKANELPEKFDELALSVDCAFKGTEDSDFVVIGAWGRKGAKKYKLGQARGRWDFVQTCTELRRFLAETRKAHGSRFKGDPSVYIEDKANGPAVISALNDDVSRLIAVDPEGGKVARANAVAPTLEAGDVLFPEDSAAPWMDGFVAECLSFPNGKNDDQVDEMTQALRKLTAPVFEIPKSPKAAKPMGLRAVDL